MSVRRDLKRRSSKEWTVRLGLSAVAALLGYYAVTFSIAQVVSKSDPALAYQLAPYDGRLTAAYATSLSKDDASMEDRARADALGKRALRQDAMAIAAAATLGLNADVRGDNGAARRYFNYAQMLSRRDLRTQLFMIEDAVQRGDIRAALHQYDITLRVFPSLDGLLYPVLVSAGADPAIRRELVRTLAGKPLWAQSFIGFVAEKSADPNVTAALFIDLRRAGVAVSEGARAGVVNALIVAGHVDAAWSYYATVHPRADRRKSRDAHFTAASETPSHLDWLPINDGSGLTTSIEGGRFEFTAPASIGGPMLQQIQLLPPGKYRLAGHSLAIEQADTARPYWALICQGGRELGRVEVPNSRVASGTFIGTFNVPMNCSVQTLVLVARPSDAVSGLSGAFDRVELMPVTPQ